MARQDLAAMDVAGLIQSSRETTAIGIGSSTASFRRFDEARNRLPTVRTAGRWPTSRWLWALRLPYRAVQNLAKALVRLPAVNAGEAG